MSVPNASPPESQESSLGLDPNIAGLLTYLFGAFSGIVFLVLEKKNSFVRFHAYQSTVTFLAIFVVNVVIGIIPLIGGLITSLIGLASVVLWVLLMIKAFQGERFKLPMVGDMAEERAGS
jgi:uncharacterized membrane protein